jgi:endonuclease/exonuclease/phosphatase (EEP) superfamily protein YafD
MQTGTTFSGVSEAVRSRRRRAGSTRRRLAGAGGWLLAGSLGSVSGARMARLDESSAALLLADGLAPLLWLPAMASLAIGVRTRRPLLASLSAGLAAVHLARTLPRLGLTPTAHAAQGATSLRRFTANLQFENPDSGPIAAEIRAASPDVVLLQELSPRSGEGIARSGVLDDYGYSVVQPSNGAFGMGVWSRLPLTEPHVTEVAESTMILVDLEVGERPVSLCGVHTVAPLGAARERWRRQLDWLDQVARRRRPLIMAGDFNATRWHRRLSRLLASGLDDAHERAGRGWATTWPRNRTLLLPLMLLDHVLVSSSIGVQAVREGEGAGSDHRPVLVDLLVP